MSAPQTALAHRGQASGNDAAIVWLSNPKTKQQLAMALPKTLTTERFVRLCMTCIRKTPKLVECDMKSLMGAMFEVAQLGLEPSTPLGQAWILPYGKTAQVIIGYKGYITLAWRGAGIIIIADVVYEGDDFDWEPGYVKRHKPVESEEARGDLRHAYMTAIFPDGRKVSKVINKADIAKAKASSAAVKGGKKDSPWFTNEASMWIKTAVRRGVSMLPMSPELARAMEIDDQAERGEEQNFDTIDVEPVPEEKQRDDMISSLESEGASLGITRAAMEELITRPLEEATPSDVAKIRDAFLSAKAERMRKQASQGPSASTPTDDRAEQGKIF